MSWESENCLTALNEFDFIFIVYSVITERQKNCISIILTAILISLVAL